MVSPPDKEGGEIHALNSIPGFPAEVDQARSDGEALTYSSYRAFADPQSAPYTSQYLAARSASGWRSEAISPRRERTIGATQETQYRLFSEDLSKAWLASDSEPPLSEEAIAGQRNLYRRDNETGAYEAQCPALAPEPNSGDGGFKLEPQGSSADGSHLLIWANRPLTPDAAPGKATQLYECIGGDQLRLASVLPNGEASPQGGSAGTDTGGLTAGFGFRENNITIDAPVSNLR